MNTDSPAPSADSPRTDAAAYDASFQDSHIREMVVDADLSRTLERELSAANAEVARLRREVEELDKQLGLAIGQRDELMGSYKEWRALVSRTTAENDTLAARVSELERDRERLKEALRQIVKMNDPAGILNPSMTMLATSSTARSAIDAAADAAKDNTEENK